ncbi:amidophosphoribosyltransferase [bacterium]|nr:amidophosphoribosyltransferase [bacterium]
MDAFVKDKPKTFCGIMGVYDHPEAAEMAYLGLYALQHRGQEGAGIVSSDGETVYSHKGRGLVNEVFTTHETIKDLKGRIAIGHNRYSTTGADDKMNIQPILVNMKNGPLALGHNGNLVNGRDLRTMLQEEGALFQTTTDSEIIVHLIARSQKTDPLSQIREALNQVRGAYSLVMLTKNKLIAARDPHGFRPLALGSLRNGSVIASETCAMDLIGAEYVRDVHPGEILVIDERGVQSECLTSKSHRTHCIFEFIYFSRPDSRIFGEYVDKTRRKLGKELAMEHPAEADIVIAVPDSSNTAALGYANHSGIPFELGLIRNHYIGRTFIEPHQNIRDIHVKVKFNPVGGVLRGKRVVVVEDSIVRGTTLKILARLLRKAGAKEIHVRVSSPPIRYPCYYGMDFPSQKELIASSMSVEEVKNHLDVDSLGYLSLEGLISAVPKEGRGYCTACFDGQYPVPVDKTVSKNQYIQPFQEIV